MALMALRANALARNRMTSSGACAVQETHCNLLDSDALDGGNADKCVIAVSDDELDPALPITTNMDGAFPMVRMRLMSLAASSGDLGVQREGLSLPWVVRHDVQEA